MSDEPILEPKFKVVYFHYDSFRLDKYSDKVLSGPLPVKFPAI